MKGKALMPRLEATIKTRDGLCPASLFTPAEGAGPWPAVIFFMDGLGIRPLGRDVDAIIVDFHCEATGEKQAMGKRRAANATGAAALRPHGRTPREPLIFQFTDHRASARHAAAIGNPPLGVHPLKLFGREAEILPNQTRPENLLLMPQPSNARPLVQLSQRPRPPLRAW
jgi:hypothetical protein